MTTTDTLTMLRDALARRGIDATGPHRGNPSPEWDFLRLEDGRHVHCQRDLSGFWQCLVYQGGELVRMADVDGGYWPGDPAPRNPYPRATLHR